MDIQKLKTLGRICKLERTQLLTIIAISDQSPQLDCYHSIGNLCNFLYVESSTACVKHCPPFLSTLEDADKCFARVPIYYQDIEAYLDPTLFSKR